MVRAVIAGSGAFIPPNRVTNEMLSRIMDVTDEWIRDRSGVETRHYVDEGTATSDLGVAAAIEALKAADLDKNELDLIIFATMTPDYFFPGCGGLLQSKLGIKIFHASTSGSNAPAFSMECSWPTLKYDRAWQKPFCLSEPKRIRALCHGPKATIIICMGKPAHRPPVRSMSGIRASAT